MDEEALYSTTDQVTARKICDELCLFVPSHATVVDATACVGGLTYTLTNTFQKVIAIEIDETRYRYLKSNMELLNVSNQVECICGNVLDIAVGLNASLIIIDPPWGGPEYKTHPQVSLDIGGMNIAAACMLLYTNNPTVEVIAIKTPINFNEDVFRSTLLGCTIVHKAKLRKMCILILKKTNEVREGT
jgi:tRNA G37 N-methylase Trm5